MSKLLLLRQTLRRHACLKKAKILQSFFKTGKGQYGEGDVFIGVTVPQIRAAAKQFSSLGAKDILKLLHSKIHEERLLALLIWVMQYEESTPQEKTDIAAAYLANSRYINNWDLVDLSSPKIIGDFLLDKKRNILYKLAKSTWLWDRRIAVVSTYAFIRNQQFSDTFKLAKLLLNDKEDLMHKACGWMLREAGKRDRQALREFLEKHSSVMPRTMLRYAIEHFSQHERKTYLAK